MYFRWNSFDDLFSKRNSCPVQIFFLLQVTIVKSSSVIYYLWLNRAAQRKESK